MPRLAVLEGYENPFGGYKRRKKMASRKRRKSTKRRRGGRGGQKTRMRVCARSWKRGRKRGSYRSFMKKCLSGRIKVRK